jgi:protein-disulfide isomerase
VLVPLTEAPEAPPRPAEARRGRWFVVAVLAIGAIALGAAIVNIATQKAGPSVVELEGVDDAQRIFGGLPQDGDRLGPSNAPVTIQVFNDVQWKGADEQFLATVPTLVDDHVRSGDVQLDYRHYSFSPRVVQEGFIAAEAAGEQGYLWQFVYLLFRNQDQAERFGVTDNLLESIANSIGELDVPKWKDDFAAGGGAGGAITRRLEAQDEIARELGLRADPAAIVTGPRGTRTLQDSPTLAQIEAAIEAVS